MGILRAPALCAVPEAPRTRGLQGAHATQGVMVNERSAAAANHAVLERFAEPRVDSRASARQDCAQCATRAPPARGKGILPPVSIGRTCSAPSFSLVQRVTGDS